MKRTPRDKPQVGHSSVFGLRDEVFPELGEAFDRAVAAQKSVVLLKHRRDEPLTAGVANGDVGEKVIPVVRYEVVRQKAIKWVAGPAAHDIVAKSSSSAVDDKGRIVE